MSKDDIPEMDFVSMDADFESIMKASVDNISKDFKAGDKVEGVVTMIGENSVFVDINGKSEGIIPKTELIKNDEISVSEGDTISAYFLSEDISYSGDDESVKLALLGKRKENFVFYQSRSLTLLTSQEKESLARLSQRHGRGKRFSDS